MYDIYDVFALIYENGINLSLTTKIFLFRFACTAKQILLVFIVLKFLSLTTQSRW